MSPERVWPSSLSKVTFLFCMSGLPVLSLPYVEPRRHDRRCCHAARNGRDRGRAHLGRCIRAHRPGHARQSTGSAACDLCDVHGCGRRAAGQGTGALLSGPGVVYRRTGPGAARPRRPGGDVIAGGGGGGPRSPAGGTGRIHPARVPQRQARPGAGGSRGRPHRERHGAGGACRPAFAQRCVLHCRPRARGAVDRDSRLRRGGDRFPRGRNRFPGRRRTRVAARGLRGIVRVPVVARDRGARAARRLPGRHRRQTECGQVQPDEPFVRARKRRS